MSKPNFIPGMKLKGIGRRSLIPYLKSKARAFKEAAAKRNKSEKELARRKDVKED